jgi:putative FmdB family regulatory protein
MPIYEYKCEKCSYHFENLQKFSDPTLDICPKCQTKNLKKLISSSTFNLKGSGWHNTDYKKSASCGTSTSCPSAGSCPAASKP